MGRTGQDVVDPLTVISAGAIVCMRYSTPARAEKRVGESYPCDWWRTTGVVCRRRCEPSRPYAPSTLLSPSRHPSVLFPVRALASINGLQ